MKRISEDLKGAVIGFVVLLSKGLLSDERWDWDVDHCDWAKCQSGFADPTILKTTLAVFLNNLTINDDGTVANYRDARFRGFQYFRSLVDPSFPYDKITPKMTNSEIKEPDWRIWEA